MEDLASQSPKRLGKSHLDYAKSRFLNFKKFGKEAFPVVVLSDDR